MTRATLDMTAPELGLIGWMNRTLLWLIALGLLGLGIARFLPLIQKNIRMQQDVQLLQEEVRRLQVERYHNQLRIHALQADPRAVERELRENHGYALPDEQVLTFRESGSGGR